MVLSLVYWSLRRLLELIVLRRRSEREKEIEILLLRHQLRVLERQVARPTLTPADRVLLAAFSLWVPKIGFQLQTSPFRRRSGVATQTPAGRGFAAAGWCLFLVHAFSEFTL